MDIYDQLGKLPEFSGVDKSELPARVSSEWDFSKSSEVVTLMVGVVGIILEQGDLPDNSIAENMWQIPTFFALRNHKAWIRLIWVNLSVLWRYVNDIELWWIFWALKKVNHAFESVFDGKVYIWGKFRLEDDSTVDIKTEDDINSLAYYLVFCSQSGKNALAQLQSFVTPE